MSCANWTCHSAPRTRSSRRTAVRYRLRGMGYRRRAASLDPSRRCRRRGSARAPANGVDPHPRARLRRRLDDTYFEPGGPGNRNAVRRLHPPQPAFRHSSVAGGVRLRRPDAGRHLPRSTPRRHDFGAGTRCRRSNCPGTCHPSFARHDDSRNPCCGEASPARGLTRTELLGFTIHEGRGSLPQRRCVPLVRRRSTEPTTGNSYWLHLQ